jgi:arylsulfatase A-like enzyme
MVLIIADDMSWDDCGAYGHPTIKTPHIDRMAARGMIFNQAFLTASSCSPSRASIITGKYPHQTDAEQLHWPLPGDQVTFVELLREHGYYTAAAGKWHLGNAVKDRFDTVYAESTAGFVFQPGDAGIADADLESGCGHWLKALNERETDKPFFLWLAAVDPHRPYRSGIIDDPHRPEEVRVPPYLPDAPEVRADLALYYDEISRLDSYVGVVMEALEEQGIEHNTLVLFISDNGRPFPRDKTTLYDGGIKTPWILHWPGAIPERKVCNALVSAVDIAPTMLDAARLPVPPSFEGNSVMGLIKDPAGLHHRFVYAEDHWHDYEDYSRAVRSQRFKYIRNYYADLNNMPGADIVRSPTYVLMKQQWENGSLKPEATACFIAPRPEEELYDLAGDPFELHNLAADPYYADTLATYRKNLEQWRAHTGDVLPARRTPDEFDRNTGLPLDNRIRPRPSKREMQHNSDYSIH